MIVIEVDESDIVDEAISTDQRVSVAMRLLDARVPLSLLFDLLSPDGPDSESILEMERPEGLTSSIR
jgi:hypothetical protein